MVGSLFGRLKCNVLTCGIHEGAVIKAQNITDYRHQTTDNRHWTGLSFDIKTPDERFTVHSGLVGMNNVYNILMSVGVAYALGVNTEAIIKGIADVREVKGRFEKIEEGQDFLCIVDYAHTEDALRNLITEARHITKGRIITVFGCGGDRDRLKRPRMGFAATDLSDFVIITSDNPRTEDPIEIIKEITAGIKKDNFIVEVDRALAIEKAVSLARAGDTLLVAGKGHEDYQEVKGVRYPFSDKEVLKRAIKNRG
jgi:UDP-N-acetylmuramoyl-L-alanyl-D-glutamate--2,6-diaminopimelate ligase